VSARILISLLPFVAACGPAMPEVRQFGGPTMGSTYEVKFVGGASVAVVRAIVEDELAAFDAAFSQWRADSEIARVNEHRSVEPLTVSGRFAAVLRQALDVAAATDGAFDPTVKPLSDLYRAAKRDPGLRLDPAVLDAAKARVDWRAVEVRDGAIRKARPDVELDLDGIVAGACADAIAERLAPLRLQGFYLEITGEVLCRGDKGPHGPWRIGVVDPIAAQAGDGTEAVTTLALRDAALCTSGDYQNFVVRDGRRLHHVFDPRTGRNPQHVVASASVLAASAAWADAFGTAFLVLGAEEVTNRWPRLGRFGLQGALLLVAEETAGAGGLRQVEIAWPRE
jgi:thiamine biosynthesis lipoprotein